MFRLGLAVLLLTAVSPAIADTSGVDRVYVLDCGAAHAPDQSRWSPGVNVGQPIDIVDNCYLIHHKQGYLLWDTGVPDDLFGKEQPASGPIPWRRSKTLVSQLAAVGVQPADIKFVGISHTHGDHIGNVELFPSATVLIQQAEYDWAFASAAKPFSAGHPVEKLDGEKDVFGDGSVRIVPTPGHTPGHESLMVDLPKTGWLVLSGDVAHFKDNFDNRRVPGGNTDKAQSVASMQHVAELLEKTTPSSGSTTTPSRRPASAARRNSTSRLRVIAARPMTRTWEGEPVLGQSFAHGASGIPAEGSEQG